jgi:hypothetical protein
MRDRAEPIRREGVREAGDESRRPVRRELTDEQKHTEAGGRKRREQQQVVAEQRILRHRPHRQNLDGLRGQVLGVCKRVRVRMKDVGVPIAGEGTEMSFQGAQQMIRIPGENPAVEEWIAEVAGDIARQAPGERPGQRDRERAVGDKCDERVPCAPVPRGLIRH